MTARYGAQAGPTIWDAAGVRPHRAAQTISQRYDAWRDTPAGQTVYAEAVRRSYRLRARGLLRYGIGAIAESIRFDRSISVGSDDDGFKLNNDYRALMAREIMAKEPDLDGFFETRQRLAMETFGD